MGEFDDDLSSILSGDSPYIDADTRGLARERQKLQSDIERAGYSVESAAPRQSLFWDVLDTLDAPRQGVAGVMDAYARGDIFTPKVGTGWRRGQIENTSTSDVLGHLGVEDPIVRAVGGFAGDVLTDPLSWLSFGASSAAKVGGRALTEAGLQLSSRAAVRAEQAAKFLPNVVNETDSVIKGNDLLNQAFVGASKHQEALRFLEKADSPDTIDASHKLISQAMEMYKGVLDPSEVVGRDIFDKSVFRIERELPFIGNIINPTNRAREAIDQDQGPVGQALRMAGAIWNPGKLKITEINIPDNVIDAFDNIRMYSNEKLMKAGDALASLPLVGAPIGMAGNFVKELGSLSRKIFMQKSLVGADANNNRLRYVDYIPAAKQSARDMVADHYGDLLKDPEAMKEGLLAYDAQMIGSLQEKARQFAERKADTKAMANATWAHDDVLESVNNNLRTGKVSDNDIIHWKTIADQESADEKALQGVQTLLNDPNIPENVKQVIQVTHDLTGKLRQSELDAGIDLGYVAAYIPHRFTAGIAGDASSLRRATTGSFTKERSYESLAQAFEEGGKVADLNLASIMEGRINNSLLMQGQRNFFNRLAIEEGLDPRIVQNLYREARSDPNGPAAKMLQKKRLYFSPVDKEALQEGVSMAERQKLYSRAGKGDESASKALLNREGADVQQKVNEELWLAGQKPLDNKLAQEALGEMGDLITIPGGKEQAYLPKPMADMFKEAIAGKDFIKSKFGESSRFGKAAVNLYDYMANFSRKMVTLPFSVYYFQNALGATFQTMMNGASSISPGLPMRVASVLAGKSTITSPNGTKLTQASLKKIAQHFGLKYDANSYLDGIESFTRTDPTKLLQRKNPMWENLKQGNIATGLRQAQEKANGGFESYLRMTEFVNRFEKGDSIADAARAANQSYFNYRDMSPIEKSLAKRFYMFYGFTSKATGQSLNNLLFTPSNLNLQINGSKAMAEAFADPKDIPTADEADIRLLSNAIDSESISAVIGRSKSGKPITARGFAAPLQQVLQTFSMQRPNSWNVGEMLNAGVDSIRRTAQKQFASANPVLNSAVQNLTGRNLYFDKPLDSEFLRKLPSYEAIAGKLTDSNFAKIPARLLDNAQKKLLGARDNGDGTMTADPGWFWTVTQLVPALSRANSSARWLADEDVPGRTGLMRALTGINISDTDPTRTYLYDQVNALRDFSKRQGVKKRLELLAEEGNAE